MPKHFPVVLLTILVATSEFIAGRMPLVAVAHEGQHDNAPFVVDGDCRDPTTDPQTHYCKRSPVIGHCSNALDVVPGGMTAVTNYLRGSNLNDVDFFITVDNDPGTDDAVFWAQQFFFEDGDGGYIGIQTVGETYTAVPRVFIYSIWNALDAVPGEGVVCVRFGGEGEGWSCRMQVDWVATHKYRLRVANENGAWWGAWITDTVSFHQYYLGRIRTPATWGKLRGIAASFTEYFGTVPTCSAIDYAKATFHHPVAENGSISSFPHAPRTYGICAAYARISCDSSRCIQEIGVALHKIFLPMIVKT